jgi:hypothetical protein
MSPIHLHLVLNHVPVIGVLVAVATLGFAVLRRREELIRFGFGMLVVLGLVGAGVYFTGEPAEESLEDSPGISELLIEGHEDAALVATVLLGAAAVTALWALVALRREPGRSTVRLGWTVLILALAPALAMAYTAYLGGQIQHAELRPPSLEGAVDANRTGGTAPAYPR